MRRKRKELWIWTDERLSNYRPSMRNGWLQIDAQARIESQASSHSGGILDRGSAELTRRPFSLSKITSTRLIARSRSILTIALDEKTPELSEMLCGQRYCTAQDEKEYAIDRVCVGR